MTGLFGQSHIFSAGTHKSRDLRSRIACMTLAFGAGRLLGLQSRRKGKKGQFLMSNVDIYTTSSPLEPLIARREHVKWYMTLVFCVLRCSRMAG